ncbi:MAG TPA: hypothetical protein EYO73_02090 [Sulfurimonas sp.]|nr:hypothetical protein [Sulfurimonas sp.]
MSENIGLLPVNEKKDYHDCEMTFCMYYENTQGDYKVDKAQKYHIHTTLKEVDVLNEALNLYQEEGFKDTFLSYSAEVDGDSTFPEFTSKIEKAHVLGRALMDLANDEDSLVQLQEYCIDQAPRYVDDFGINKQIESITINNETKNIEGYEDLKTYISELKVKNPSYFS